MGWIFHWHGSFSLYVICLNRGPSVVVKIVEIKRVAIDEPKNDSPISADSHRPKSLQLALKRMEAESGQVHIRDGIRSVQPHKNVAQSFSVLIQNTAMVILFIKAFEALVAD